jgi:hypothetical protein
MMWRRSLYERTGVTRGTMIVPPHFSASYRAIPHRDPLTMGDHPPMPTRQGHNDCAPLILRIRTARNAPRAATCRPETAGPRRARQ